MNIHPLYPENLADDLESIYLDEISPVLSEKVAELKKDGTNLFNLEDGFEGRLSKWFGLMVFWHKNKMVRISQATQLPIVNDVPENVIGEFVSNSVAMIKDLTQSIRQMNISPVLERIFKRGVEVSQKTLVQEIINETGAKESKAQFWARDQVSKLNSNIDQLKYKQSGIQYYIWLAGLDGRTRASHREKHGKLFNLNDDNVKPGEEYNCRCSMRPAIQEEIIRGGLTEDAIERAKKRWGDL